MNTQLKEIAKVWPNVESVLSVLLSLNVLNILTLLDN